MHAGRAAAVAVILGSPSLAFAEAEKQGFTNERADVVPPLSIYKSMAEDLQDEGWMQFQAIDGKQIISFAPVMALRCRIKELHYSVDNKDLGKSFPVPPCNPDYPFEVVTDGIHNPYAIELDGGTAQAVALQLTWDDGSKTAVAYYEPCRDVDTVPCAYPLGFD